MVDYYTIFIILTLVAVIIVQIVERYVYSQHMQEEQGKLIKAVLSKDVKEYTEAIKAEKDIKLPQLPPDEIPLGDATEEEFNKFIKQQTQ